MFDDVRETTGVLAGLIVGVVLVILVLLASFGGGFLLALLALALLPLGLTVLAIDNVASSLAGRRAAALAAGRPAPAPFAWSRVGRSALAGIAILAIFAIGMSAINGFDHMIGDLKAHPVYLALVMLGGALLVGMTNNAPARTTAEWRGATLSLVGVIVGLAALMSCCLVTLTYQLPLISALMVAVFVNEVPIVLGGLVLNGAGLVALARAR